MPPSEINTHYALNGHTIQQYGSTLLRIYNIQNENLKIMRL